MGCFYAAAWKAHLIVGAQRNVHVSVVLALSASVLRAWTVDDVTRDCYLYSSSSALVLLVANNRTV